MQALVLARLLGQQITNQHGEYQCGHNRVGASKVGSRKHTADAARPLESILIEVLRSLMQIQRHLALSVSLECVVAIIVCCHWLKVGDQEDMSHKLELTQCLWTWIGGWVHCLHVDDVLATGCDGFGLNSFYILHIVCCYLLLAYRYLHLIVHMVGHASLNGRWSYHLLLFKNKSMKLL